MAKNTRYTKKTLPYEMRNTEAWAIFDCSALDQDDLRVWKRRRDAVLSYLDGDPVALIRDRYGYQCHQVIDYLNRCVRVARDGQLIGWRGLIKGLRTDASTRRTALRSMPHLSKGGYFGALNYTLDAYPAIKASLDRFLATGVDPWGKDRGRVVPRVAHQVFLELCTEAGIANHAWPFCVERQGRNSLTRYMHAYFEGNHQQVALYQFGVVSRDRSKRGKSPLAKIQVQAPFEIVEADEHQTDRIISVGIETPKGIRYVPCRRLTLILAVDRFTSHILGWILVVRRQISSADFLECVDKAINGQCLSDEIKAAMLACTTDRKTPLSSLRLGFNSLFVDNALAHLTDSVCTKIREQAGAAMNFGAVKTPKRRSVVERVFNWMARELFQRSKATTGRSPVDTRRINPEQAAVRSEVTFSHIMRAAGDAVARWNNEATEANYGSSPSQQMLEYYSSTNGVLAPLCPPNKLGSPPLRLEIVCTRVRGSQAKGRHPYVTYASVEYSSRQLADRWDLIGTMVRVHADPYDVSVVNIYSMDGEHLGDIMPVSSRWRHPHSLEMRKLLKAKIRQGHDQLDHDPAKSYLMEQEQEALEANAKSPKVTQAASFVAEEARKGHTTDTSATRAKASKQKSTKQLVDRVRNPRDIDFRIIGRT